MTPSLRTLALLGLLAGCSSGTGGTDAGPQVDSGPQVDAGPRELGNACDYVTASTATALLGTYNTQPVSYPTGERLCIFSSKDPATRADDGAVSVDVGSADGYITAQTIESNYQTLLHPTSGTAPSDSLYPVAIPGADASYVLVYPPTASEPRASFVGVVLKHGVVVNLQSAATRVADNAQARTLAANVLIDCGAHIP
jgi:hypothetical protein